MVVTKPGKNRRPRSRQKKTHSAHGRSRCRGRARFPAAPNVVLSCNRWLNLSANVPSAALNFIPASNALTSILPADSSVPSLFPNGSHEKTSATNAASIPCESWWRRKPPLRLRYGRGMPDKRSRTCSRSKTGYGFSVGRSSTSLANDWGACVTSIATTCATSDGWSIFFGSLPSCGLRSV